MLLIELLLKLTWCALGALVLTPIGLQQEFIIIEKEKEYPT